MSFMEDIASSPTEQTAGYRPSPLVQYLQRALECCNHHEIIWVRGAVRYSETPKLRKFSIAINHLGNGWLYAVLVPLLLLTLGRQSWHMIGAAAVATALAHSVYPVIKRRLRRLRPCDIEPSLHIPVPVLDRYSCPSGHAMTATAVAIPIGMALPSLTPILTGGWLLIAWARISLGHHYPSDILFGALLAGAISLPVSLTLLH